MSDDRHFFGLVRNVAPPIDAEVKKPEPNGRAAHDDPKYHRGQESYASGVS